MEESAMPLLNGAGKVTADNGAPPTGTPTLHLTDTEIPTEEDPDPTVPQRDGQYRENLKIVYRLYFPVDYSILT